MNTYAIALTLHILAVVIWVGGMFFAYMCLRPAAGELDPPVRLGLWSRVFARFFPWVWASVLMLWATGLWIIFVYYGGFSGIKKAPHIHLMLTFALAMTGIYWYVYFSLFSRFQSALKGGDFNQAAAGLNRIRVMIAVNLTLGILTVIIGAGGRLIRF